MRFNGSENTRRIRKINKRNNKKRRGIRKKEGKTNGKI